MVYAIAFTDESVGLTVAVLTSSAAVNDASAQYLACTKGENATGLNRRFDARRWIPASPWPHIPQNKTAETGDLYILTSLQSVANMVDDLIDQARRRRARQTGLLVKLFGQTSPRQPAMMQAHTVLSDNQRVHNLAACQHRAMTRAILPQGMFPERHGKRLARLRPSRRLSVKRLEMDLSLSILEAIPDHNAAKTVIRCRMP